MTERDSKNQQTTICGIFNIPINSKATRLLYPDMDEESYELVENLRDRVLHAGKTMKIEEHRGSASALLVGQSKQIGIFIRECDLNQPHFFWLRLSKIRQLFYPNWVVSAYLEHGRLPGEPPFISGLEWEIETKKNTFWLTCSNPPIAGEISYSSLARRFQGIYPDVDKPKGPPTKKHKEEGEGAATCDLKPIGFGGIK